jgi:predicted anti-sigma-YlaC factor YlaD
MKCPEVQIFEEYLNGELSTSVQRELEAHFASCSTCRVLFTREQTLDRILRNQRQIVAPLELHQQIMASLESPKTHRSLPEWMWVLSMGLVVIALGFISGIYGSPYLEGLKLWFKQNIIGAGVLKSLVDLGQNPKADWLMQLPGVNSVSLVNLGVAGIILCWGLWQMFKALRR